MSEDKSAAQIANAARKSLMLDKREYSRISAIAKKAGVARPMVLMALLETCDETRVIAKLQEIRANEKANAAEERKKRQALSEIAGSLSMNQIEALLKQLNPA